MTGTITMIHNNYVAVDGDTISLDRKFLTGMRKYAEFIHARVVTINPLNISNLPIMDKVSIDRKNLGFDLITIDEKAASEVTKNLIRDQISKSNLIYGYTNWNIHKISKDLGVPYILVLECDLKTHISKSTSQVNNFPRRISRTLKTARRYIFTEIGRAHV